MENICSLQNLIHSNSCDEEGTKITQNQRGQAPPEDLRETNQGHETGCPNSNAEERVKGSESPVSIEQRSSPRSSLESSEKGCED